MQPRATPPGTTLHAALMERRLARARLLIGEPRARGWNLARIAAETGFASHAHLSTAFRRALGLAPSRWRVLSSQVRLG